MTTTILSRRQGGTGYDNAGKISALADSIIDQDYSTTASPAFAGIHVGGVDYLTTDIVTTTSTTPETLYNLSTPINTLTTFSLESIATKTDGTGVGVNGSSAFVYAQGGIINNNDTITATFANLGASAIDANSILTGEGITLSPSTDSVDIVGTGTVNNTLDWKTTLRSFNIPFSPSPAVPVPEQVSGLIRYYWASDINNDGGATNPSDDTALASWSDLSVSNEPMLQASGSEQPLFKTNILNGLPSVRFDGIDDFMQATVASLPAGEYTLFVVSNTSGNGVIYSDGDAYVTSMTYLINAGSRKILNGGHDFVSDGAASGVAEYVMASRDGTTTTMSVNGTPVSLTGATTAFSDPSAHSYLSSWKDGGENFCTGDIFLILLYDNNISDDDKTLLNNYIATLYGF